MAGITDKTDSTGSNTLAHELVAREEQNVGIFFASFAIQFYMKKEMLKQKLEKPTFLIYFGDVEIFASQRVLIKNLLSNNKYKKFCEVIEKFLIEHNQDNTKMPHDLFLKKINKAFLIRQIFKQTDQVLPKYNFIESFIGLDIARLDIELLHSHIKDLAIEQQILIVCRIFTQMKDSFESKKKSINQSFLENAKRIRDEYQTKGKTNSQEFINIQMLLDVLKDVD